jgi:hypothetical protein
MNQCENVYMDRYTLPHGEKGIEGEEFAVEVGADKLVFVPKSAGGGRHYTLHTGPDSGVIDLHETQAPPDGQEQHRTLFAMRRDDLPSLLLGEGAAILSELLGLLRPLRLGWLKHRDIGIARGIEPVSDADIAAVTRKHKRRLTLDRELYERNVFMSGTSSCRNISKRSTISRTATSPCFIAAVPSASASRQPTPGAMSASSG